MYAKTLGPHWGELHGEVRDLHTFWEGKYAGKGEFAIRHGSNILARVTARMLRMPEAGENVPVSLQITEHPWGEHWLRTMGVKTFPSAQRGFAPGRISERAGPLEIHFQLKVDKGCLAYRLIKTRLHCFGTSIPLPRWLSPRGMASECPAGENGACRIRVEIAFPLLGSVLIYDGLIRRTKP